MPDSVAYGKRLVKGSTIVFTAFIASGIIALLLRMFLARSFSVAEYGLFYAVFVLISFFELFRGLGFDTALVKHVPEFVIKKRFGMIKSSIDFVLLLRVTIAFLIVTVFFAFSNQIALTVFGTSEAVPLLLILGIWFILMSFSTLTNTYQGFQNMLAYASLKFLDNFFVFIFALLLVGGLCLGPLGAAYAYLFTAFTIAMLGFAILRYKYPMIFKVRTQITKSIIKTLSKFALPIFLTGLVGLVIGYMDTIMITVFRTLPEVGYYQAAQPMSNLLFSIAGSVLIVFFPMVSELWAKREQKLLGNMLHFLIKFSFIFIIPAVLIFIAFPEIIINVLFGSNYLAGAAALQILSLATVFHLLTGILNYTLAGIGKPIITTKVTALMAGFNLVWNLLLIPTYGIEGAAAASLGAYLLGYILLSYYARKSVKFTVPISLLIKIAVGAVLTLIFIFGLKSVLVMSPLPEAFIVGISSFLFYGGWILATKAVTKDDLKLIAKIVPLPKRLVKFANRLLG